MRAAQQLQDEAVRRARYGVARMVLYKGAPVMYQPSPTSSAQARNRLCSRALPCRIVSLMPSV